VTAPAVPLEKAVEEAERWVHEYGGEEYLSTSGLLHARDSAADALRSLLAALDADKRLERAEDLLRSASRHLFRDAPMSMAIHDYFARREEKGEPNAK